MKTLKLLSILVLSGILISPAAKAQYDHIQHFALGLRGSPDGGGANLRVFLGNIVCVEGQVNVSGGTPGGSGKSTTGVGLVEFNVPLYTPAFRTFLGAGLHYGSWERYENSGYTQKLFGYDLIMGLEYTFHSIPLSVSLDFKPAFSDVSGVTYFPNNSVGLGIRYYFWKWEMRNKEDSKP